MAAGLRGRGIGRGSRIIVHLENCPEFLISWFACVRIGAVAVCTNTRSSEEELAYFGEHSGAVAAITQPSFAGVLGRALPQLKWLAVTSTNAGDPVSPGESPGRNDAFQGLYGGEDGGTREPMHPLDPAWIQYTSGTTSRPKGVVLTHANALWGGKINATHEGLSSSDVHFVHLPLFHINALSYSMLATMWAGGAMVLVPRFSVSRFWDVATRNHCTWAGMIPFSIRTLASREVPPQHDFRTWGVGWCSPAEDEMFGIRTMAWYGMTETVAHPVMDEVENRGRPMGMGRPTAEYQVAVVDESGSPVEPGETGAIFVRGIPGVSLFAEYLDDETATAETLRSDGWMQTGDRATVHEDGFLSFADREKDMLKVGGENVAASEIERVIMGVPGVSEVAVVAAPHAMLDEIPIAFVTSTGDRPDLAGEVVAACSAKLASFKVPAEVRVVTEMPRSTLNKIAKAELRRGLRAKLDVQV